MKRLAILLATILMAGIALLSPSAIAQSETAVTGAGEAIFPTGAHLFGVPLNGLEFGNGVAITGDGSAIGDFQSLLSGTSLLGQRQNIDIEGKASSGFVNPDGSVTFGGAGAVDLGDGSPPLLDVPFSVTVTTRSLRLVIGDTALPTAMLTAGSITIR